MADWLNISFKDFDYSVALFFNNLAKSCGEILGPFSEVFAFLGKGGIFPLLLGVILLLFKKTRRGGLCILLAVGVGALFTNVFIKNFVARPRPYQSGNADYTAFWEFAGAHTESEYSFPSGHATVTVTSMVALLLSFNKKWSWVGLIYALFTCLTRIYLGVHYTTDVIGGIIIGSLAGVAGYYIVKAIYRLLEKKKDAKFSKAFLSFSIVDCFKKK